MSNQQNDEIFEMLKEKVITITLRDDEDNTIFRKYTIDDLRNNSETIIESMTDLFINKGEEKF
jgi:hypothetical protein